MTDSALFGTSSKSPCQAELHSCIVFTTLNFENSAKDDLTTLSALIRHQFPSSRRETSFSMEAAWKEAAVEFAPLVGKNTQGLVALLLVLSGELSTARVDFND